MTNFSVIDPDHFLIRGDGINHEPHKVPIEQVTELFYLFEDMKDENLRESIYNIIDNVCRNEIIKANEEINLTKMYDIIMSCLDHFGMDNKISETDADEFFRSSNIITERVATNNPFYSLGHIFSLSCFEVEMVTEISDLHRAKQGLPTMEGVYPCPKCHAPTEDTISALVQTRRADEPIPFKNRCLICSHSWDVV